MIQIRKSQQYTVTSVTEVAKLDPEKFRNLSTTPYTGETDEDFMNYIEELGYDLYDLYDELDEETQTELDKLFDNADWDEIHSTAWDGEDSWFEVGEVDEEYRKTGGFRVDHDTFKSTTW